MSKREKNRKKKQNAILEAALIVFSEKGYAAAKIIDIARAANVGKGTIYEYHRSKEDLFFALFLWYGERMVVPSLCDADALGDNAEEGLKTVIRSVLETFNGDLDTFGIFLEFWAAAGNPAMRDRFRSAMLDMYRQFRTVVAAIVEKGKKDGSFRRDADAFAVAAGIVGALDGMTLQAWMDRQFDMMAVSGSFIDTLIAGIKP